MAAGPSAATCLDLHAALRGAHEQDAPGGPVEDGGEVELPDDVGGRRDEHRRTVMPLMSMPRIARGHGLGLVRGRAPA